MTRIAYPPVGVEIEVQKDNRTTPWYLHGSAHLRAITPDFSIYRGRVLKSERDPPFTFRMDGAPAALPSGVRLPPSMQIRILDIRHIKWRLAQSSSAKPTKSQAYTQPPIRVAVVDDQVRTWKIRSSKGDSYYTVTLRSGEWRCYAQDGELCKGLQFHKSCRHIQEAQTKLEATGKTPRSTPTPPPQRPGSGRGDVPRLIKDVGGVHRPSKHQATKPKRKLPRRKK